MTSRPDDYMVAGTETSTRVYACPNVWSNVNIVHCRPQYAGVHARAAGNAVRLRPRMRDGRNLRSRSDMDPVELRKVNDTRKEPIKQLPIRAARLCSVSTPVPMRSAGRSATESPARCATATG